jgi:hypothetical protein
LRRLVICLRDPQRLTAAAKLMLKHLRAGAADDYRKTMPPVPIR